MQFSIAVSIVALAGLVAAEPLPKREITCAVQTTTVTPTCTGIYNCPVERPCTATTTTTENCGGPGPACLAPPTPTVTITEACTPPCRACEFSATATHCTFF